MQKNIKPLHFYKLLHLIHKKSQIDLRIPETIIFGFGFHAPTFICYTSQGLQFEEFDISQLQTVCTTLNTSHNPQVPYALIRYKGVILKSDSAKMTASIVKDVCVKHDNVIIQRFVQCNSRTPHLVRLYWKANQETWVRIKRGLVAYEEYKRTGSVQDLVLTQANRFEKCVITHNNSELITIVSYLRRLLESSIFQAKRILRISLDLLQGGDGKWYILKIQSYKLRKPVNKQPLMKISRTLNTVPSLASADITLFNNTSEQRLRRQFASFEEPPKSPPRLFEKLRKKDMETEFAVQNLLNMSKSKNQGISYINYRDWKKRREDNKPQLPNERAYASRIAAYSNRMSQLATSSQADLKVMVSDMKKVAFQKNATIENIVREACVYLLNKISEKKKKQVNIQTRMRHFTQKMSHIKAKEVVSGIHKRAQEEIDSSIREMEQILKNLYYR